MRGGIETQVQKRERAGNFGVSCSYGEEEACRDATAGSSRTGCTVQIYGISLCMASLVGKVPHAHCSSQIYFNEVRGQPLAKSRLLQTD